MRQDPALYRKLAFKNYIERLSRYSRTLSEIASDVQLVEVNVSIEFCSGVLNHPVVEQYHNVFTPCDVVKLVFKCPNRDCTSGYFDITSEVISLIQKKKNGSGKKYCEGKEDVKYCGGGSFCNTTLEYEVRIG